MPVIERLRCRVGVWLLRPALHRELAMVRERQADATGGEQERYWMGRFTGVYRIERGRLSDA